jgi:hypothetical protein
MRLRVVGLARCYITIHFFVGRINLVAAAEFTDQNLYKILLYVFRAVASLF